MQVLPPQQAIRKTPPWGRFTVMTRYTIGIFVYTETMNTEFSMVDSFSFGWKALWPNRVILVQAMGTFVLIMVARGVLTLMAGHSLLLQLVVAVLALCGEVVVGVGITSLSLAIVDGKGFVYRDLFLPLGVVVRYVAANLLVGVIVILGLILLVIPGLYAITRFCMVRYAALEEGGDAFAVLARSSRLTDGIKWRLLGFLLVLVGINILGALVFLVGLVVSVPLSMLAFAHLYREVTKHTQSRVEA